MAKVINILDAKIQTATVEIQTLTISGKQVTLAVFRQLWDEDLISHDGKLEGLPWGHVNYHPDKCADDRAHIHVVWQKGSELRRAGVALKPFGDGLPWVPEFDLISKMFVRDFLMGRHGNKPTGCISIGIEGVGELRRYITEEERLAVATYGYDPATVTNAGFIEKVNREDPRTLKQFYPVFCNAVKTEIARRKRVMDAIESLQELPQLFIAV